MKTNGLAAIALAIALAAGPGAAHAQQTGRVTGGEKYEIPEWFTQSFLDISEDAAEAAQADRHAMLFIHSQE